MEFHKEGDDWAFTRRRMMILAAAPGDSSQASEKI